MFKQHCNYQEQRANSNIGSVFKDSAVTAKNENPEFQIPKH